jgi:hypothetical protein
MDEACVHMAHRFHGRNVTAIEYYVIACRIGQVRLGAYCFLFIFSLRLMY